MKLRIRGETVELLSEKGALWHDRKILMCADLHLGKAAFMRKLGAAIPEGSMRRDLETLSALVTRTQCRRLLILGDFIHAGMGLTAHVIEEVQRWLNHLPCAVELVPGNHDRALLKRKIKEWNITIHQGSMTEGPFCFTHEAAAHPETFSWGGHLHPLAQIGRGRQKVRVPCFWIRPQYGVLPSFGSLTGGVAISPERNDRVYAVADNELMEVS